MEERCGVARVLVVDDDEDIRDLVARRVRSRGHRVPRRLLCSDQPQHLGGLRDPACAGDTAFEGGTSRLVRLQRRVVR
jgi:hypothetical protein